MNARASRLALVLLVLLVSAAACSDDEPGSGETVNNAANNGGDAGPDDTGDDNNATNNGEEDAGDDNNAPDVPEPDPCADEIDPANPGSCLTPSQDGASPTGLDVLTDLGEDEVRVGQVSDETGGMGGVEADCKMGDWVLVNALSRFCIDGEVGSNALFFDGGRIIDAEPNMPPPPGEDGRDSLHIISPFITIQVPSAAAFKVVRDGSDGALAVLRVEGRTEPSALLAGVAGPGFFQQLDLEVVTEYRLRPGARLLEMVTFVTNAKGSTQSPTLGDIPFWGDTTRYAYPGHGTSAPSGGQTLLAWGQHVAYGWLYDEPFYAATIPGLSLPATPTSLASTPLTNSQTRVYRRHLAVGADMADVLDAIADELPDHPFAKERVEASITVRRGGQPFPHARVEVVVGDDPQDVWYAGFTNDEGILRLRVDEGAHTLRVSDDSGAITDVALDTATNTEAEVDLPEGAVVDLRITRSETEGGAASDSPAKVTFWGAGEPRIHFVLRGRDQIRLPAGSWEWEAALGTEWSAAVGQLELSDGDTSTLEAHLVRAFETPGYVSGEFHQHSSPSLDSEVPVVTRVMSNIAEGVDFAVSSDHDIATDFGPIIDELGANDLISTLRGVEVSPLYGHFGAYPVQYTPHAPARGALLLSYKTEDGEIRRYENGQELIAAMRSEIGAELIQINHPRDSTGYFDDFGWDRDQSIDTAEEGFSLDVDTMEVINGENCDQFKDWFSLLNQGVRIVGVGNSDTHSVSKPVGYPRNYLPAEAASPDALTEDAIIAGVKSGDLVISAAVYLDYTTAGGERPGQLVESDAFVVDLRVLTPPWARADRLLIFRNGELYDEMAIGAEEAEAVDFDGPIELRTEPGEDAWFVVTAWGSQPASRVYRGNRVFAIGNPFYLDGDGDGIYTAPGVRPIGELDVPICP